MGGVLSFFAASLFGALVGHARRRRLQHAALGSPRPLTFVDVGQLPRRDLQLWDRVHSLPRRRAAQQLLFTPNALCRALLLS